MKALRIVPATVFLFMFEILIFNSVLSDPPPEAATALTSDREAASRRLPSELSPTNSARMKKCGLIQIVRHAGHCNKSYHWVWM